MNEKTKRKMLRSYFTKQNFTTPIVLIIIGVLGMLPGLGERGSESCLAIGGICVGLGILILVLMRSSTGPKATDQQVDEWLTEDMKQIVSSSLDKLGLDQSQVVGEPLVIRGPILWATTGVPSTDLLWNKGADGIARFAIHRVTVIQLTDQLLGAYACDFNYLKNVTLNASTQEFHWRDVVSVSTQEISTSYTLPNNLKMIRAQAFKLAVASGESINVTIGAVELEKITGGKIPTTGAEKAVQVIRTMLREKKQ